MNTKKDFFKQWLLGKTNNTKRAYIIAIREYCNYHRRSDIKLAILTMLRNGYIETSAKIFEWRNEMVERMNEGNLKPKTINLRLAAIRSIIKKAHELCMINWSLDVPGVKAHTYKDTRGPGVEKLQAMMDAARRQKNRLKALRDVALLRLLFDLGLRRSEIVALNVQDVNFGADHGPVIWIKGKGRLEKEPLPLSPQSAEILQDYLEAGIFEPNYIYDPYGANPLVRNIDFSGNAGSRLSGDGLYYVIKTLARKAGIGSVRPSGIRHSGATVLLDWNNGNVRETQKYLRIKDLNAVQKYDDNRKNINSKSIQAIADSLVDDMEII
jgi:integrase/recombinase XerC